MPRKLRATSCAVAVGTIISALNSSRPTTRMDSTVVVATTTASSRLSLATGSPAARANSSSLLAVNSCGTQPQRDREHCRR